MSLGDTVRAIVVVLLFGMNFPINKLGLEQLQPLTFLVLRFTIVAVLLAPWARLPRKYWREVAILSVVLGFAHFTVIIYGLHYVDASVAAIAIQIQVPFAALLAAIFFGDRLGWRRALGMVIAITGVVILVGEPTGRSPAWAVGLIVVGAGLWATSNIIMKRLSTVDPFALNGWMAVMAVPQLAIACLLLEEGQWAAITTASLLTWSTVIYNSVVIVIIGYTAWYGLLRRYSINLVVPWTLLLPLFGVGSSMIIRDEPLTWHLAIGGIATMIGVTIIMIRRPKLERPLP
ncbi:MAG: EamA family transporter [Pseudomonadota bacterium]